MSRSADRRTPRHLESTAEDAAVLFSSLLASRALPLPAAVAAATSAGGARTGVGKSGAGGSANNGSNSNMLGRNEGRNGDNRDASAAAAAATSGLDWLAGVFRLGLACEESAPGEAASALASAPEATSAALASFLAATAAAAAPGTGTDAAATDRFVRRVRRAGAGARWLACRLMACGGEGRGRWPWPALRRDCALQVRVGAWSVAAQLLVLGGYSVVSWALPSS